MIAIATALSIVGTTCEAAYGSEPPTPKPGTKPTATAPTKTPAPAAAPTPAPKQLATGGVAAVIAFARAHLGEPYVWGGVGPHGFDCSGLVQTAFAAAGVHLPRGSRAQAGRGVHISRKQLAPGDLVFSNHGTHVQLYIGDDRVIEAARRGTLVRVSKMLPARMISGYVRISVAG